MGTAENNSVEGRNSRVGDKKLDSVAGRKCVPS